MVENAPDEELERLLAEAKEHPVAGWDFSWLESRIATSPLPWDYEAMVLRHARTSPDMLDIGTGGGEWLAALAYRAPRTVATEAWGPNVDLAGARLRPLAVTVVRDEGAPDNAEQEADDERGRLPFPSESFQLVVNRHAAFAAKEVARVLVPGGRFVTQQIGGSYDDFHRLLGLPVPAPASRRWGLPLAHAQLQAAGLSVVESGEGSEVTSFADVGAVAWYLVAVPWTVPGFSPDRDRARLADLHARIAAEGPVHVRLPAFWLDARKPAVS